MIDHEAETLLREAFRSREHLVEGRMPAVLAGARRRVVGRRRARVAAAACGVLLVGAAVVLGFVPARESGGGGPGVPWPVADVPDIPGWRWEGALGALVAVPQSWGVNDYGCLLDRMSGRPSVVRPIISWPGCGFDEGTTELAFIDQAPVPIERARGSSAGIDLPERAVNIDGRPARRAEGRLPDGRYAGWIQVDSPWVAVTVRTRDAATTARILDSVRLVDVDMVGCATTLPAGPAPSGRPSAGPFVPEHPTAVSYCYYYGGRLYGSTELTGAAARDVAVAFNDNARRSPVASGEVCGWLGDHRAGDQIVLAVRDATRATVVWTGSWNWSCDWNELFNGDRTAYITSIGLQQLVSAPLFQGRRGTG